jgi:hypothetical protein
LIVNRDGFGCRLCRKRCWGTEADDHGHAAADQFARTAAAGALQRAGLIRYKRGNVTIIDRRGLIRRSRECYGVSKKEFDRLLGDRAIRQGRSS